MKHVALTITILVSLLAGSVSVLIASWASAAAAPPYAPSATAVPAGNSNGLLGSYYSDAQFGMLRLTRKDATVKFDWGTSAPAANMPVDSFSVRWTGQVQPRYSENYTFRVTADDGARLWVSGAKILDAWNGAYGGVNSASVRLNADQRYGIAIEFRENRGAASIKLEWSSAHQRLEIIPQSRLTPPGASAAPASPTAVPPTAPSLSITATRVPTQPPATSTPVPTQSPAATTTPTQPPAAGTPRLLFGIGPEADSALQTRLVQEAPVRMLTSWYNGPNDLSWMAGWKNGLVPRSYASGYALHLVVFSGDAEMQVATQYGTACGRPYPLSDRFPGDMRQLAQTFAGAADGPPLYVTLFTEFQTYACKDNAWIPDSQSNAYYRALKDRYLETLAIFHQEAPNARVSLSWGGWQTRWDDPATGAGRSMFQYFADVMHASDFQSFQAMQSDTNVADVRAMVRTLGAYGPVMLAHYKPDNGSQTTFEQDLRAMLTDSYLTEVTQAGLFAWSFMDNRNLAASTDMYQYVKDAVTRYGADAR